jgi:hypothetical protein
MARKRSQQLSEAQDKELLGYYSQSKDALVRTRCQAVRLYGQDYAVIVFKTRIAIPKSLLELPG